MSNLLTRILMSIVMAPLAMILYFVTVVILEGPLPDEQAFMFADLFVAAFVVIFWLGLWRRSVRWTRWRITWTVLAGFSSIGLSMAVGLILSLQMSWNALEFFIILAGIIAIPIWLLITLLLWRETSAERAERLRQSTGKTLFCPSCGYNMTGLYEARCPECGSQYTLDQLLAGQEQSSIDSLADQLSTKEA